MKTNDNLQEIKSTLEKIRADKYPGIASEIIERIVDIQFQNQEKERRVTGRNETHQAIKQYIDAQL